MRADHFLPPTPTSNYHMQQRNNNTMPQQSKEANITLAIEAIHRDPEISIRQAAKIYMVSKTTLRARLHGRTLKLEKRNRQHILTSSEEDTLVRYILDLDSQGFPPQLGGVRDMANLLLATR